MARTGVRFTASQLAERGYSADDARSEWSKDDLSSRDSRSPRAEHQSDELDEAKGENPHEEAGTPAVHAGTRFCLVVTSYRTKLIDPSNASMKQIEDCLTPPQGGKKYGIGIFPDDSAQWCDQPLFLQELVKKGEERTEVMVMQYELP